MVKAVFLSPSTQEHNEGIIPGYIEETVMNEITDLMEPLLDYNGIGHYRNDRTKTHVDAKNLSNELFLAGKIGASLAIHSNAGGGVGTVAFTSGTELSRKLANAVYKGVAKLVPSTDRGVLVPTVVYTEIYKTLAPSTLIELAFHDSLSDATFIVEHKMELAIEMVKGLCEFFGVEYREKSTSPTPSPTPSPVIEKGYGIVTASVLNIRDGRGTQYPVIGQFKKGDKVKLLYLLNGWWSVDVSTSISSKGYGFISADWITTAPTEVEVPKIQFATVKALPYLNVRSDANGTKIGILNNGSEVWIMGEKDGWYKVAWGNNQGWVSKAYIVLK